MLASLTLTEIYKRVQKKEDLGCAVKAAHLDPISGSLFIAFEDPYKICDRVFRSEDVTDETVAFARLNYNSLGTLISLEIIPKQVEGFK